MKVKVLVVDGPKRGSLVETEGSHRFLATSIGIVGESPPPVVYYVHRLWLLGRQIRVASTKINSDAISAYDAFEYIASDLAKEAAHYDH
jgi:hypothetical protein